MALSVRNRRVGGIGTALVAALGLCAVAFSSTQAKAQVYFDFIPGGISVGLAPPAPYYYSPYYAPAPYYMAPPYVAPAFMAPPVVYGW